MPKGSIVIRETTKKRLTIFCADEGIFLGRFVDKIINQHLDKLNSKNDFSQDMQKALNTPIKKAGEEFKEICKDIYDQLPKEVLTMREDPKALISDDRMW